MVLATPLGAPGQGQTSAVDKAIAEFLTDKEQAHGGPAGALSRRRVSIAALTCYRRGHRSRLIYRPRRDDGRRDGRKSFSWRDYRDLLIAAHQQVGGPIVLVWDNCETDVAPFGAGV